ncbi:MAG: elongation factor P [Anaerolineae bacterium]
MIPVTDLRRGVIFELDGELYRVLEYHHSKPARGNAYIRTKARNVRSGATLEKTFVSGDRVQDVRLDHRTVQYLYNDGDLYYFMDQETFEQIPVNKTRLDDLVNFLVENMEIQLSSHEGEPIDIELPTTVDLEVVQTEPGFKGDTASAATKPATVSTGLQVPVPLFVNVGDVIRIDTRDGSYLTRVK